MKVNYDVEKILIDFIQSKKDICVTKESQIKEIGLDSIEYIEILVMLEEFLGIEFEGHMLEYTLFDTIEDLVECIKNLLIQSND